MAVVVVGLPSQSTVAAVGVEWSTQAAVAVVVVVVLGLQS